MARLTDSHLRSLKPHTKTYRIHDGDGLYAEVTPKGSIYWRLRLYVRRADYRLNTFLTLGRYPHLSLRAAREVAQQVKACHRYPAVATVHNTKPSAMFRDVAAEWLQTVAKKYDEEYLRTIRQRLDHYILPKIGGLPINSITTATLYAFLLPIAERLPQTASRCRIILSSIFRYAAAQDLVDRDITVELRGQLPTARATHFPAPTDPQTVGQLLGSIWGYNGTPYVRAALKLLPYLFVRSGELLNMKWTDIDFEQRQWRYTASKTGSPHIVPLPRQAVEILESLPKVSEYVFVSPRTFDRPLSQAALTTAYVMLGLRGVIVPHSWRAVARTMLQEVLGYPPHIIEMQLAHTVREPLGRAYNRTAFLAERTEMMQRWADWLDELREKYNNADGNSDG